MQKNMIYALVLLVLASLACQAALGGGGAPPATQPADSAPAATSAPATQKPPQPQPASPSKGAGLACVGTSGSGLACLDGNGWTVYTRENSELASNYITNLAACPDGKIAVGHYDGISLFDGKAWSNIPAGDFSNMESLACDAQGRLWVAHFQGVSRFENGSWTKFAASELANSNSASDLVYDVTIAPDGAAWVVTANSVAAYNGSAWAVYQQGQGFTEKIYFNTIAINAIGQPVVSHSNGLFVLEDGKWSEIKASDYLSSSEDLVIDSRSKAWLGTSISGLYTVENGAWSQFTFENSDLSSDTIQALAADASGRVWAATEYGLSVFDGAAWQVFRMDNSDLPVNDIESVVVVADGPTLPAPTQKEAGSLSGKVKNSDGSPVSNATVEICVEIIGSQFFGDTPCSDQPFFVTGATDAEGNFVFENIPTGYYTLVMKVGDGWAQLTGEFGSISEQVLVRPGQDEDIGDITIE